MTLDLGLHRTLFQWIFVIADVQSPILGADFLQHFWISGHVRMIFQVVWWSNPAKSPRELHSQQYHPAHLSWQYNHWLNFMLFYQNSLTEFHVGLSEFPELYYCQDLSVKHNVTHHITAIGPWSEYIHADYPPERLKIAKQEFEQMLQQGIIRLSSGLWASPLHMVPKKTPGDLHPRGDYHALNRVTTPDSYPVPHIYDFTTTLHGSTIFSPSWIWYMQTSKFLWSQQIYTWKPSSHLLDFMSLSECYLVYVMLLKHSMMHRSSITWITILLCLHRWRAHNKHQPCQTLRTFKHHTEPPKRVWHYY